MLLRRASEGDAVAKERARAAVLLLLQAYGHMMLCDGLFHSDPHPGNMLVQVRATRGCGLVWKQRGAKLWCTVHAPSPWSSKPRGGLGATDQRSLPHVCGTYVGML